jgi:hypothetical protein
MMPTSFAWVVSDHQYTAAIDAYDRDDLIPHGGLSSGSRTMVDPFTGQEVLPRWTTACGVDENNEPGRPTTVFLQRNITVQNCSPLEEVRPVEYDTALVLNLASVRGNLQCGSDSGQVGWLRVQPENPELMPVDGDCDESLTFSSLQEDRVYRFFIEASEAGSTATRWATTCEGKTKKGITLPVTCHPLSRHGALVIDIDAILGEANRACTSEDIVSYRATLLGKASTIQKSCTSNAVFGNLEPSSYQMAVEAFDHDGHESLRAFCEGVVRPGETSIPECQVLNQ